MAILPPSPTLKFSIERDGRRVGTSLLARPIIKIGSRARSQIVLDDPGVSGMHAVIEVTDDAVVLIDLGGEGGTHVNGKRINKASLDPGDVVTIGPFQLRLESVAATPPAEPVAVAPAPPAPAPVFPVRDAAARPTSPTCARCSGPLADAPLGTGGHAYRDLPIRALRCGACAITFVDVATLERRLRRTVRVTGTAAERSRKSGHGQCPLCRSSLDRVTLEWAGSWATVEECSACGLLALEQGELAVIERLAAVALG